jgi:DNA replication initiation complex subunit (GINS family)
MYDVLFEAWRKERENPDLQSLPKDFYAQLSDYVRRIREERRMIDEESVRGRLLKREEENVKRMISDLIQTRYGKMMKMAAKREIAPLTALTSEEESLYDGLLFQAETYEDLLRDIMQGQRPKIKKSRNKGFIIVRILKEIPQQFIGADMKMYGPFKPEDITVLPEENAKALIKQGVAEEIEVK